MASLKTHDGKIATNAMMSTYPYVYVHVYMVCLHAHMLQVEAFVVLFLSSSLIRLYHDRVPYVAGQYQPRPHCEV